MSSNLEIADDTKTRIEQVAAGLEKSPAEIRASIWEKIADADLPVSIDADEFYQDLVESVYTSAVVHARDVDLEATADADDGLGDVPARLNPWADGDESPEEYGTGIKGDRTREDYLQHEKQVDILSEAIERADVDRSSDQE